MDGRFHNRIQQQKTNWENDRLSPNKKINDHNRFATFADDNEKEEKTSEMSVSMSVVSNVINDRNKNKTIDEIKTRHEEDDQEEK